MTDRGSYTFKKELNNKDVTRFTMVPPVGEGVVEPKRTSCGQGRNWVYFVMFTDFPLYRYFCPSLFSPSTLIVGSGPSRPDIESVSFVV